MSKLNTPLISSKQMAVREYDYLFKIILVGDSGVGKTSLLTRYSNDPFNPKYISTIGIDFKIKKIQLDNKTIKIQLWDTSGQERFRTITPMYYRGAMAIILVYDITDEKSFKNIQTWMNTANEYSENYIVMILGNKSDMGAKRVITTQQGKDIAAINNAIFFEISAKENENVDDALQKLVQQIKQKVDRVKSTKRDDIIQLPEPIKDKKKSFCLI